MRIALFMILLFLSTGFAKEKAGPYRELLSQNDLLHGLVTAREVSKPTRANLDLAAWTDNSLFVSPGATKEPTLPEFINRQALDSIMKLPWFDKFESKRPHGAKEVFSFPAVKRAATIEVRFDAWNQISGALGREPKINVQRLWSDLGTSPNYWIELQNRIGYTIGYAKINSKQLADTSGAFHKWLKGDYSTQILDSAKILDWATQLASYWYPSLNTDLVWDLPSTPWPSASVGKDVLAFMRKKTVANPTVVIRGNPLGTPHFTVLSIPGIGPVARRSGNASSVATATGSVAEKLADRQLPENYIRNMDEITSELQTHGGDFAAWDAELQGLHNKWKAMLDSLPSTQMGFSGQMQWLFFRRSLAAIIANDWTQQTGTAAPLPALIDFKGRLEDAEVNMLFVPVPSKEDIYPDLLPGGDSTLIGTIVNSWERRFVQDAQEEGMEIVDLLPPFIASRKNDAESKEFLFQKDDTHWTRRGMLMAAQILAARIKQYSWYASLNPNPGRFEVRDTLFTRLGDIVERLPAQEQTAFPPVVQEGSRVFSGGVPYQGGKGAPIVLIGDSFTGVMESVDCRNGGVGAHIARLTGLDVEVITSWGGGPNVRAKFLKARKAQLAQARLVIYMMTSRDLYHYPDGWEPLDENTK